MLINYAQYLALKSPPRREFICFEISAKTAPQRSLL